MKIKSLILICCLAFFSSCIVKSIQPFYTAESTEYQENLVGDYTDNKKANWSVVSLNQTFLKNNKDWEILSNEEKAAYEQYKDGYVITYTKKDDKSAFIFMAMPFKVDEQLFMDFIPFNYEDNGNDLASQHLLRTHSVAKIDTIEDNKLNITWLAEGRLKELFEKNQLKLNYETVGLDETFVLTASSEELYAFLKKYMKADIKNKWESSEKFTLTRTDAQP